MFKNTGLLFFGKYILNSPSNSSFKDLIPSSGA
jgi:hypothetical protein